MYETVKAEFNCSGHIFSVSGKRILCGGFKELEESFRHAFRGALNKEAEQEEGRLPELFKGQAFFDVKTETSEHYTKPPQRFTEDSLLSAMEHAGDKDMGDDVERRGLGTPATRADIIEKLVRDGYVTREKKQMIPTQDGINLISVLPETIKSPKLTAEWENTLALVAKGEYPAEGFMEGIENMVAGFSQSYFEPGEEQKKMFEKEPEVMGRCPVCGHDVINLKGKKGGNSYDYFKCSNKDCQFLQNRECGGLYNIIKRRITDKDMTRLLLPSGLTTECISSSGKKYRANVKPKNSLKEYKGKMYVDFEIIPLWK